MTNLKIGELQHGLDPSEPKDGILYIILIVLYSCPQLIDFDSRREVDHVDHDGTRYSLSFRV